MIDSTQLITGIALAALVAGGGYAFRALSVGGALAATGVGGAVFGLGGPSWGMLLVLFFVTSSLFSRWSGAVKARAAEEFAKGGRRDAGQVLANGGVPAALALLAAFSPGADLFPLLVGALAVATADTWATELGLLSRASPRLITTGRRVAPGTSGAVSPLGLGATVAGGAVIGLAAAVLAGVAAVGGSEPGVAATGGVAGVIGASRFVLLAIIAALVGSLLDSLLGATVQGIYHCSACGVETEQHLHRCGTRTLPARGWSFLTNDRVNLAAITAGAVVGWGVARVLAG
jgi:uncharacterized protein (TIGR00297 family)